MNKEKGRLVYFENWPDPIAQNLLSEYDSISIRRLTYDMPSETIWRNLAVAHLYQVSAARHEVPKELQVQKQFLRRCPKLLAVSTGGAGYDTVDVEACSASGIIVVNQTGANKEAVAEHALAMILSLSKRIPAANKLMRLGSRVDREKFIGHDIANKTLGIIGLGNCGYRLAQLAKQLFGMSLLVYDPYIEKERFSRIGAESVTFDDVIVGSDVISVHCPLNDETRGMFDSEAFRRMKKGALFVTTARGGIHDEEALFEVLSNGHLCGAGLDVWAVEPPSHDNPLLQLDNVFASPHIAGVTYESRKQVAIYAAEQIKDIFAGRKPPRLLNPQIWPTFVRRFRSCFG